MPSLSSVLFSLPPVRTAGFPSEIPGRKERFVPENDFIRNPKTISKDLEWA
jgi:hypothetical protein